MSLQHIRYNALYTLRKIFPKETILEPISKSRKYNYYIKRTGETIKVLIATIKDDHWEFRVAHNMVPEYFLLIALDNQERIVHQWILPRELLLDKGYHTMTADSNPELKLPY